MFGKKRRELEKKLQQECEAHQRDLQELEKLRAGFELKKKNMDELQNALELKIQEMDNKSRQFDMNRSRLMQETREEIEQEHTRAGQQLRVKLEAFSNNYGYYLSQLKLIMDILTKASITAGESFLLQDETDTTELFQKVFNKELDGHSIFLAPQRTDSEQPEASSEYHIKNPNADFDFDLDLDQEDDL